ncbi:ribonuclease H2, subunit C [Mycena crocata]|nr:ribonuclease H2, subunit C [Mycena crocata]
MAAPTLSVAHTASLPNTSPNLMPFHINHNGPAFISTYFLVEAASEHVAKPPPAAEDLEMAEASKELETKSTEAETISPDSSPEPLTLNTLPRRVTEATTRFVATFRGRTLQGLKVELPCGYAGVTMTGEGTAKTGSIGRLKTKIKRTMNAKERGSKTGRATRSATRAEYEDEMEGVEEPDGDDQKNARTLIPTAQFSSFVLWHPDIPVDPGRDEYLRSLTEWIRLADEIHRVEE